MDSPQVRCALDIRSIDGFCGRNARAAVEHVRRLTKWIPVLKRVSAVLRHTWSFARANGCVGLHSIDSPL